MTNTKRAGALALLLLPSCVAISGAGDYTVGGNAQEMAGQNDAGGKDNPTPIPPGEDPVVDASTDAPEKPIAPPTRPLEATYTYAITGGDELKGIFPFKGPYGPTATMTITYEGANCFNQKLTLRNGYDETMHECISGFEIVHDKSVRAQTFGIVGTVTTNQTCAPGDTYFASNLTDGKAWPHTCLGTSSDSKSGGSGYTTAGPYKFVGIEGVTLGDGTPVKTAHFRGDLVVTGKQNGANVGDWYFEMGSGLLVRLVRTIDVDYKSFGNVTYLETVNMTLLAFPGKDGGS